MTCTVKITLHALSQRSPAESIGKGQKLIEAARPERAEALKLTLKFIKLLPLQVGCSKSINFSTRFLHRNTS